MTHAYNPDKRTRQLTEACWKDITDRATWTESYDIEGGDIGPNHEGRVQLSIFVCAPFGKYDITLDVKSYTDDPNSRLQQRTAWTLENGENKVLLSSLNFKGAIRCSGSGARYTFSIGFPGLTHLVVR